jgi:amino acid transporter
MTIAGSPAEHKLKSNDLGLFESSVMGLAGSAPAYSVAATTAVLAGYVALSGPGILLYSGIAMFGIVFAFNFLGKIEPNAGATYRWVRRGLHPILGYFAGWSLVTASIIFMFASTLPAGSNILGLFTSSNRILNNVHLVTLIGVIFFMVMVCIVAYGVKFTARAQVIMTVTEIVLLLLFDLLAFLHHPHVTHINKSWFTISGMTSTWLSTSTVAGKAINTTHTNHGLVAILIGAVAGAFYYWGWDVTANLNEETKDSRKTAGHGGIIGVIGVFILLIVTTIAINMVLTQATVAADGGNVLGHLGQALWPGWGGKLIVVSVILSTVATLETQLIQVTRTLFSMGRDKTMPQSFGRVHSKWLTPINATVFVTIFSLAFFLLSQWVTKLSELLTDAVNAIGIQVCFYYSLAAFAMVILYRHEIFKSAYNFIFMGLWPLLGGIFMTAVLYYVIPTLNSASKYIGLGTVAIGVIPMAIFWAKGSHYFHKVEKHERRATN